MKKATYLFLAGLALISLASCGTISGRMSKVALVDCPRDLQATADGESLSISNELTVSKLSTGMKGDTYTDYYSPVVKLDKHKTVVLQLKSGSATGSVELKPKFSGPYFWGNMFLTGFTGMIVDFVTGNHRQHRRFVDVPAVLAGKPVSEWRSKSKLKKAIKKSAR